MCITLGNVVNSRGLILIPVVASGTEFHLNYLSATPGINRPTDDSNSPNSFPLLLSSAVCHCVNTHPIHKSPWIQIKIVLIEPIEPIL